MASSHSAPDRDQSDPAPDTMPADRVARTDHGVLKTVCCEASVVMDGVRSVCAECRRPITEDLGETLDLLGVE